MRLLVALAGAAMALAVDISRVQHSRALEAAEANIEESMEIEGPGFSDRPSDKDGKRMKVPRIVKSLSEINGHKPAAKPVGPPLWARPSHPTLSSTLTTLTTTSVSSNGDWDFEVNTCGCSADDLKWLQEPPAPSASPSVSPTPDPHRPFPLDRGLISFNDYFITGRSPADIQASIMGLRVARYRLELKLKEELASEVEHADANKKVIEGGDPSAGHSIVTVPVPPTYTRCRCGDAFPHDWLVAHIMDLELVGLQGSGIVNAGSNPVQEAKALVTTDAAEKQAIGHPEASPLPEAAAAGKKMVPTPIPSPALPAATIVAAPVPGIYEIRTGQEGEGRTRTSAGTTTTTSSSSSSGSTDTAAAAVGGGAARFAQSDPHSEGAHEEHTEASAAAAHAATQSAAEKAFADTLQSILGTTNSLVAATPANGAALAVPADAHPAVLEAASAMRFAQAAHDMLGAASAHGKTIAQEAAQALHAMTAVPLNSDAATAQSPEAALAAAAANSGSGDLVLLDLTTGTGNGLTMESQPWGDLVRAYTQGALPPTVADGVVTPGTPHSLANPWVAANTIAELSPPSTSGDIQAAISRVDDLIKHLHTAMAEANDNTARKANNAAGKGYVSKKAAKAAKAAAGGDSGSNLRGAAPAAAATASASPSVAPSPGSSPWYDLSAKMRSNRRFLLHPEGSSAANKQIARLREAAEASKKRVIAAAKARAMAAQIDVNRMRRYAAAVAAAAAHQAAVAHEQLAVDMGALRERVAVAALASEITARSEAEKARIQLAAVKALLARQGHHAEIMNQLAKRKAEAVSSLQGLVEGAMERRTKALEEAAKMREELESLLKHAHPSATPKAGAFSYDALHGFLPDVSGTGRGVATPTPSPTATPTPFFAVSPPPVRERRRSSKVVRGSN